MLNIIKTAIITIIISFISGVLLDNYKNLGPRILCTMGKAVPLRTNPKRVRVYNLIVKNISNKTIHNLSINVQGHNDNMKVEGAKITKGLKFNLSSEDNIYNVSIPFLSKNDEFSLKLIVERNRESNKKPIVILRSPENFKKVSSEKNKSLLSSFFNINELFSSKDNYSKKRNGSGKSFFKYTKAFLAITSIALVIYIGIFGVEYYETKMKMLNGVSEKVNASEGLNENTNTSKDVKNTESNIEKNTEPNKGVKDSITKSEKDNNNENIDYSNSEENTNNDDNSYSPSDNKNNTETELDEQSLNYDKNNSNTNSNTKIDTEKELNNNNETKPISEDVKSNEETNSNIINNSQNNNDAKVQEDTTDKTKSVSNPTNDTKLKEDIEKINN